MTTYRLTVEVDVVLDIPDDSTIITRCTENHDEHGVPQPDVKGGRGWRNYMYDLQTREEVLEHLAFNVVANHVDDIRMLDGWADVEENVVQMRLDRQSLHCYEASVS